ncbi:MAG: hypothetical protein JXR64_09730 [Spirochaetales bacterium]|nr:hypothetical protein [Spirochaetales bacterium]
MNDIIEIYDPIYREPNIIIYILLGIILLALIFLIGRVIYKKIREKRSFKSRRHYYEESINNLTNIKLHIEKFDSYEFSMKITNIIKKYLATIYGEKIKALTLEELFIKLNLKNDNLVNLFKNSIEKAQYGKEDLSINTRLNCLSESVEFITLIYNKMEVQND